LKNQKLVLFYFLTEMKKHTVGLKSLDLTDITLNKSKKSVLDRNPKLLQSKMRTPLHNEESSISHSSRSLLRNRENSIQTYQKYLKMLDPSFLKDEDNINNDYFKSISISTKNMNNSFIPHKLLKLLPLEKKEGEDNSFQKFPTQFSRKKFTLSEISQKFSVKKSNTQESVNESRFGSIQNPLKSEDLLAV